MTPLKEYGPAYHQSKEQNHWTPEALRLKICNSVNSVRGAPSQGS